MKKIFKTAAFAAVCLTAVNLSAQVVTKQFGTPPMEYKPIPLWFWNNTTVNEAELREQFRNMIGKDGYGGCAILPFGQNFEPEYLSEEYFKVYGAVVDEAKKLGAHMSIYDEYGFPSGSMGAINADGIPRFMNKYPNATIKRLDKFEYPVSGDRFEGQVPAQGKIMSVVAMDTVSGRIVSLKDNISGRTVNWPVPQGSWKVMAFLSVKDGDPNVDYLDPDHVRLFIKETHDQYYKHFGDEFGKVISTTFFDEPTMYRAEGRMWTDNFNEKFNAKYGFSPELLYPALWYDIGQDTHSARNYLFGFRSQLYAEGFMKAIQEWSAAHGILSTGHQDQEEVVNPVSESGDLMLCGKYMDMPGVDKIGGDRPAELFYKVISSSAYNWDKQLVMSETYGAMGNISVDEMYHIAMEQYTKGINYLIPHAVWYNDQDVAFAPELSYRNPLYRDALPAYNMFLSRLNYLLRPSGRHVADIAMIYPIQSMQGDHYLDGPEGYYAGGVIIPNTDYVKVSAVLNDQLGRDFTYLHPEVLDDHCEIEGNTLFMKNDVNREAFRVLIVPGMKTISLSNMQKIEEFFKAGGHVIFTTQLPVQSVEFGKSDEVKRIVGRMLGLGSNTPGGGKAEFIEDPGKINLRAALNSNGVVYDVEFPQNAELNYIHKVCGDQSVYLFANLGQRQYSSEIRLRGHIVPEIYNPHTGKKEKAKYKHGELTGVKTTTVTVTMGPLESRFVVQKK